MPRLSRLSLAAALSVAAAFPALAQNPPPDPRDQAEYQQRLRDYVYPVIGKKRLNGVNGVSKHDVLTVKRAMEAPVVRRSSSHRKKDDLADNTIRGAIAMLSAPTFHCPAA